MPKLNVDLTDHDGDFINAGIAQGRFRNASEAVRAGLHLLERQEADDQGRTEWLRNAAREGITDLERGEYTTLRSHAEIGAFVRGVGSEQR